MNIAGRTGLGSVEVSVRIEPDDPNVAEGIIGSAGRAKGNAMVAAKSNRQTAGIDTPGDLFRQLTTALHYRLEVLQLGVPLNSRLTPLYMNRPPVLDLMAECLKSLADIGVANGTRTHVYSSPICSQVEWDADDIDTHGPPP
jgi:hypothetical protein